MNTQNCSLDTRNLNKISNLIDLTRESSLKDLDSLSGTMENQELVRVARLERRIQGTMTNPVINGGMDTKEKPQFS